MVGNNTNAVYELTCATGQAPVGSATGMVCGPVSLANESSPTGTGFSHVTSGAWDTAARAVNLATSDVTGTLPTGNQAAQSLSTSGDVACIGTTASGTCTAQSVSGSGGNANVSATQTTLASSSSDPIVGGSYPVQTTNATATTCLTFAVPNNAGEDVVVTAIGRNTANNGDLYRADLGGDLAALRQRERRGRRGISDPERSDQRRRLELGRSVGDDEQQ